MRRRHLPFLAASAALSWGTKAAAQDLPTRPIRLVVTFPPGGSSDIVGRSVAVRMQDALGQTVIVDNRPGANGAIAGQMLAKANPDGYTLMVGSIGVFAIIPSFNRALAELGVGVDGVRSTPFSGEPDILAGLSPETRTLLQSSTEDIYRRFIGLVAAARRLPAAEVDRIGQGRVWPGNTALELKLVDRMGGLDAAVAAAAKRAGITGEVRTVDIERQEPPFVQLVNSFMDSGEEEQVARDPFAKLAAASRLQLFAAVGDLQAMASGPTMQAACMECSGMGSPRVVSAKAGSDWLARLAALAQ
jgi:protease-4